LREKLTGGDVVRLQATAAAGIRRLQSQATIVSTPQPATAPTRNQIRTPTVTDTAASDDFRQRYGEWAIVTGASSGIGEAFAHSLAARGVRPLLVARREAELRRVAEDVRARHGVAADWIAVDLADAAFIDALTQACADRDVGLVVSNAAFNPAGAFLDHSRETLLRILDVNDRASLLLANAFLPRLVQRGRGGFLLVGSIEGFWGMPYSAAYSASKAFVLSLGEALWGEFRDKNVDVLTLVPGATDTPLLASRGIEGVKGMPPQAVAEIGLDHLGRGPYVVPGGVNRWAFRVLRRFPRRWTTVLGGKATRRMVEKLKS
jgi:short-subunit dehydrogenase